MIKRFTVAVAALLVLAAQALGAGTIPGFSLTPQFDLTGKVAPGCKLYVIQAGTPSTPQNPYQDSGLTILAPNPLLCDAAGRLPQWFVADGTIKVRLTKSDGSQIFVGDGLLVVGASSGGGGGSPVDPTTIIATGDVKTRYGTGVLSGFVRGNGRTIGSATSGATERANADAQALFEYLWGADANLIVSTGRGASANADWVANKTIALPDFRSHIMAGLADMGNSASGVMSTCAASTTLGSACGITSDLKTITQANLPSLTWPKTLGISNTLGLNDPGHIHGPGAGGINFLVGGSAPFALPGAGSSAGSVTATASAVTGMTITGSVSITGDTQSGGSGTGLGILPPLILITTYIKL
jgi:hypothetical protein